MVWPLVLGACGMALVWRPTVAVGVPEDTGGRASLRSRVRRFGRSTLRAWRSGCCSSRSHSASLLHTFGVLRTLGNAIGAVAIIATVLGLLFGPWFLTPRAQPRLRARRADP